jgi:hypothetical protein
MKTYKGLRAILGGLGLSLLALGGGMKTEVSAFAVRGRAPSRLAATATIALAILVTFMLIATSCSVARL